jgi:membrane protease YdiL (CAAX protease family)
VYPRRPAFEREDATLESTKQALVDPHNGTGEGALRRDAVAYVMIAFAWSWLMWILVIKLHLREAFLNIGSAGPAIAAIILSLRHRSDSSRGFIARWACFVALLPPCCIVLSLHYASRDTNRLVSHFDPLLILPAILPAWIISGAFSRDIGVIALLRRLVHQPRRWSLFALLSFPTFLLVPAIVVHHLGGHLVRPADNGKLPIVVAEVTISFAYNFLFTAVQEEPGWRGFLLDRMQHRLSPLVSSLWVWLPWALWHGPLDYLRPVPFTLTVWLLLRVVFMIPLTIILTRFYNRSGRSIQATAIFHAGMNTFPFVLPYSQPAWALIFVWAAYVVIRERMWRCTPKPSAALYREHCEGNRDCAHRPDRIQRHDEVDPSLWFVLGLGCKWPIFLAFSGGLSGTGLFGDGPFRGRTEYTLIAIMIVATISTSRSFEALFVRSDVWAEDLY